MDNIFLQFNDKTAMYKQIYTYIKNALLNGELKAGEKLPSKRRLAQELKISVNTVDTAYQMLCSEGYINSKPKSGFVACDISHVPHALRKFEHNTQTQESKSESEFVKNNAYEQRQNLDSKSDDILYNFSTGAIDTSLFPFKTWQRLQRDLLSNNPELLNKGENIGDENLRIQIAKYLHEFRAVECEHSQIIIGAGIEYLLGLLACLFKNEVFGIENPGYTKTHEILKNNGAKCVFVNLDSEGLCVKSLKETSVHLAYITPSHQFPTGIAMPIGRRLELLEWARAKDGFLIEDDYDSEFRFEGKPLPSLQGLYGGENVIYLSTFSRCIAPAIRVAYMVLPKKLLERYKAVFNVYSCTVSRFEQQTLQRFMQSGQFSRHLAKLRQAYKQRRDALTQALKSEFGNKIEISGEHTGLHLVINVITTKENEKTLIHKAKTHGVYLCGLSEYKLESREENAQNKLVLGFASMTEESIIKGVKTLKKAWENSF